MRVSALVLLIASMGQTVSAALPQLSTIEAVEDFMANSRVVEKYPWSFARHGDVISVDIYTDPREAAPVALLTHEALEFYGREEWLDSDAGTENGLGWEYYIDSMALQKEDGHDELLYASEEMDFMREHDMLRG